MVRIRLKRMGRRHRPFYRINAVEKRTQRDGKIIENLGWYDPCAKESEKQVNLKPERIQFWLSKGAQASDTVNDLLAAHNVIDAEAWKAERQSRLTKKIKARDEARKAAEAAAAAAPAEA